MSASENSFALGKPKISFWRRVGGGSLFISLVVHAIVLAVGVFIIVQIIPPPPEKVVDFIAPGGGGAPATNNQQKKRANVVRNNASRVAAKDVVSNFTLPDPEASADMSALGALGAGGMGGLGGLGNGGGKGMGTGDGVGSGMGSGLGKGGPSNPFGMSSLAEGTGAMVGMFYDLKQTKKGDPTDFKVEDSRQVIRKFIEDGWKEQDFEKFYRAKRKLYQTKFYIPFMEATAAPAAFNCEKEVKPAQWVVVYRGVVTPPKTGKYRFVGIADDVMVVRFNGKYVFDYMNMTNKPGEPGIMNEPGSRYPYQKMMEKDKGRGALTRGPEFRAVAGNAYPMEVLMSELPGGLFSAMLLVEEDGEKYEKDETGSPILPIFRLDNGVPKKAKESRVGEPPFAPEGPVWRMVEGSGKPGL